MKWMPVVWRCPDCNLPIRLKFGYERVGMTTLRFHVIPAISVHLKQHQGA